MLDNLPKSAKQSAAPIFRDQGELVAAIYRISGLVDAIYAVQETEANEAIAESAADGIYRALRRDADQLAEAADENMIIVAAPRESAGYDPVFAAISHYHSAQIAHGSAMAKARAFQGAKHDADEVEASKAMHDAEVAALQTVPATRAGALELLRHLATRLDDCMGDDEREIAGEAIRTAVKVLELAE